jgi:alpha-L-fucosidase
MGNPVGTLNNSWGYKSYDHDWKSPTEVLFWIIDIVSKGGNYMLNIGPRGDGSVPEESVKILETVGAWLQKNGKAIYGTRPWKQSKEGPTHLSMKGTTTREDAGFGTGFTVEDFWFTEKDGNVYAIHLCPALPDQLRIKSVDPTEVREVQHLGTDTSLCFKADGDDLVIDTSGIQNPDLAHAFFIRICDEMYHS